MLKSFITLMTTKSIFYIPCLLLTCLILSTTACSYFNIEQEECLIKDKQSISTSEGHTYRIYTSCGVFVVEDQLARLNFTSADLYNNLEVGKTYKLETSGYRVPFFSLFKAINRATLVN